MNLLIDIGNTRTKWGMALEGRITSGFSLVNNQINRQTLADAWRDISPPARIAVASVSTKTISELVLSVALELWPDAKIVRVNSQAHGFGVTNAYFKPQKLGVDRWLSLVAVHNHYPSPACIVDCGTAITLDLIDQRGLHSGGMICPGLTMMKKSLSTGAEFLQYTESRYDSGPANFTEAAIYTGTLMAAAGLVEHVFAAQPEGSLLILTGGDAQLIADEVGYKSIVDVDLVLRGLTIVLEGAV